MGHRHTRGVGDGWPTPTIADGVVPVNHLRGAPLLAGVTQLVMARTGHPAGTDRMPCSATLPWSLQPQAWSDVSRGRCGRRPSAGGGAAGEGAVPVS